MGLRFRKSVKIAPGVKLNLNKKSVGVTVGGKGAHYTVNSKGRKTASVGIPGTGISYSHISGGKKSEKHTDSTSNNTIINDSTENIQTEPPKKNGCVTCLVYLLIACVALALFSYAWIPGIIATIYFIVKKADRKYKMRGIAVSLLITLFSLVVFGMSHSAPELTGINVEWGSQEFDINETTEVTLLPVPEDAEIENLSLSDNDIAELNYTDGKVIITFKNEGSASLFFTANDSIKSNSVKIKVIDKVAEAKRLEEKKKAEEEAQKKAEEEAAAKAQAEAEAAAKAEEEAAAQAEAQQPQETMVWLSASGSKYHSKNNCGRMNPNTARQIPLSEAQNSYEPCDKCY